MIKWLYFYSGGRGVGAFARGRPRGEHYEESGSGSPGTKRHQTRGTVRQRVGQRQRSANKNKSHIQRFNMSDIIW